MVPPFLVAAACFATLVIFTYYAIGTLPAYRALYAFVIVSSVGVFGMKLENEMQDSRDGR